MRFRRSQLRAPQLVVRGRFMRRDLCTPTNKTGRTGIGELCDHFGRRLASRHQCMGAPQSGDEVGNPCHAIASAPPRSKFTARLDHGEFGA